VSFPFPKNPTDGQVVSSTAPDGSILTATYRAAKNEWEVSRALPPPTTITGTPAIAVTPTADGQVITWDQVAGRWIAKTPSTAATGTTKSFVKAAQADADQANGVGPAQLKQGDVQFTAENLHKEIKFWNGAAWVESLSEDTIKQWISAGSLFRGVVKESSLSTLPAPAVANRGYYFSWTGNPGHVVAAGDPAIGTDLAGEVLQVGDWIQSDGTKWVHVPGDLLSKQRWDSLGSFQPWSDTSWESGSVVSYQKAFFRASALVSPGDAAPGTAGSKWVDITPLPHMGLEDLKKVNANVADPDLHGAVFQWDDNINEWVASDTLQIGAVRFDDEGVGPEITGFADTDFSVAGTDDASYVPSVYAVKEYINAQPKPFLEELDDCGDLSLALNGQVPSWDAANSKWIPTTVSAALSGLTDVDLATTPPTDGQYLKYNAAGTNWIPETPVTALDGLSDVTLATPSDGQLLKFNGTSGQWENITPNYLNPTNGYTKTEVDTKLATLTTTLEHEESVMAIANDPPAVPTLNDLYITGTVPTGLWAGHAGKLARWDGTAWQFADPRTNETHLVEDVAETWHWNGTAWVKVAVATTATAVSTTPVGTIIQSVLTPQQFQTAMGADGSKWRLAAGGDCTGTAYATLTGATTLPDLRGSFLRMAGQSLSGWDGGALNGFTEDSTARPKNAFTGSTDSAGGHTHNLWSRRMSAYSGAGYYPAAQTVGEGISAGGVADVSGRWMDSDGAHTHTVQITGGGDAETKPKSYAVNYFIKVN